MYVDKVVYILLDFLFERESLFRVIWDDNEESIYELDTFYDSDNGLEMDDPNYKEFHIALLRDYRNKNIFKEVGSGENIPIYIEVIGENKVIWDKRNKEE